jgi:IS5 family transposase
MDHRGYDDEACEDALYDVAVFRQFCRIDLGRERVPDATTLLKFRHLLEAHKLGAAMFAKVGELLMANGMKLSGGTIVDATLIAAPPSVKNEEKARDPEMHQTKKGNQWHFGMKLHMGTDSQTGLVHSAYRGKAQRERLKEIAPRAKDFLNPCLDTNKRAYRNSLLTDADKETNRRWSSVRSKVEHPFLTLKRLWGFAKVRYRGLAKNANDLRHAGCAQHQQMGPTSDGRGASSMSRMQRNLRRSRSKQACHLMKMTLTSQFRFNFSLPPNFSAACSALP